MGRAKLKMELISNEKSRNTTLRKRKDGLIRKMHEFTTLCDVNACMIIWQESSAATEPEIWPQNAEQVRKIIDIYKAKNKDSGNKTFGVPDFFHERKRKIEEELAKLRRKNLEAKYPTAPALLDVATEPQLREFALLLTNKAKYVKSRLDILRNNTTTAAFYYPPLPPPPQPQLVFDATFKHAIDHHHHHNSAMMLLMNDSNINHFEGIQFKRQLFFESASGYWGPPLPPPSQPYMLPPPPPHFPNREEFIQYQMRNHASNNIQD